MKDFCKNCFSDQLKELEEKISIIENYYEKTVERLSILEENFKRTEDLYFSNLINLKINSCLDRNGYFTYKKDEFLNDK